MKGALASMQKADAVGVSLRRPSSESKIKMKKRNFPPGVKPRKVIDLSRFLPYRIHILAAKIARPADIPVEDGNVIRARDWRVLLQLASRGPLTGRELSAMIGLDAASITRVVQRLGELGYVTTRIPAADRRKQIISLTETGARVHDAIAPSRKAVSDELLECFSPEERKIFFSLLDRLENHLQVDSDDEDWVEQP